MKFYIQTTIATGVGNCSGDGTTNSDTFYCYGFHCNNLLGKTCWNPSTGSVATTTCTARQWQCRVKYIFYWRGLFQSGKALNFPKIYRFLLGDVW